MFFENLLRGGSESFRSSVPETDHILKMALSPLTSNLSITSSARSFLDLGQSLTGLLMDLDLAGWRNESTFGLREICIHTRLEPSRWILLQI